MEARAGPETDPYALDRVMTGLGAAKAMLCEPHDVVGIEPQRDPASGVLVRRIGALTRF